MRFGVVHHSLGHRLPVAEAMRLTRQSGALVFATAVRPDNRDQLGELARHYNLELVTHWGDRFIDHGPDQPTHEFERFCREILVPLNIRIVATASTHHRWRRDPPLPEQLDRLAAALRRLCPVAADHGVAIAIENHADYRAGDLLALLEKVNHPALGIQLDTGNPFAVAEEPVDAARQLAPYTLSTHIKDMRIRPIIDPEAGGEWVKVQGTAIGEGDVDIPAIAHLLAAHARPDLPFALEVETPPSVDRFQAFERSARFVRERLSHLVTLAPTEPAGPEAEAG